MTERTYGSRGLTLDDFDPARDLADTTAEMALAVHIRELQAENNKLKAERRELALRIAYEVWDECDSHIAEGRQCVGEVDLVAIVEQELNRAP